MMEQTAEPPQNNPSGRDAACGLHSKRLKELENAALQTTLISKMDTGPPPEQNPGGEEQPSGLSSNHTEAAEEQEPEEPVEEPSRCVSKQRVEEERTLTDHLNKRLLSSFLEKLNERDLALPGVRHLDCAVADEDSNRAADEW
ncbi:hypothetical protein NQD34_002650 [Periophthalmus magnuspinnatus]|nr:hypothetical protein NQD34_002650 [Periophthalmus magnuspinnatus]